MSEQRLFLRKKVPLPIPIELLPGKEMWLHDIGEGGLSVSGSSRLEPGAATFFSFQFPDANSMIEASGVVAWCDGSGRVGIRFTRIKPDSTAVLKRWLKSDEKQSSSSLAESAAAEPPRAGIEGDVAALRHEIARANLDSAAALDLLAERMKDRTRASGAAIALRDADAVICRASSGNAPPAGTPLNIENTVTGECYRSGNIVSITDTEKDSRVDAKLGRQLEFRSLLIVPIAAGEEVVGILEVFSPLAGNFEGGDVLLLGSIAEVAAELHRAQQRKSNLPAAQPIPNLESERVAEVLPSDSFHVEAKQEHEALTSDGPQNSIAARTEDAIEIRNETGNGTLETAPTASLPSSPTSGNEQNEDSENHWKPRNYLLLMAGLTVLGIGMGDIVDWHMTSHLRHSSAQPATTNKGQDIALLATSDPELPEQDKASLSSPANRANSPGTTLLLKKTADAKLEKSSFILKSAAQGAATAARAADSQSTASLTPSAAVPLAGPIRNLDPTITPQLTPARLLHRVDPVVPDFAKNADSNGTVLLSAVIGIDGKLKDVKFVSGDRALAIEAFRAVRDWRYRPYMLNGKPVAAETRIVMNFKP
jgi:GAF domain-containing protein/outer membrane biosynthesis protein TonB